jgi:hypothetical protein
MAARQDPTTTTTSPARREGARTTQGIDHAKDAAAGGNPLDGAQLVRVDLGHMPCMSAPPRKEAAAAG